MSILFINACVRDCSRTRILAEYLLECLNQEAFEVNLETEALIPLNRDSLMARNQITEDEDWNHPMLCWARQFAKAEEIIIAAPFWDLSFPSHLKIYLETITVSGVTFRYVNGIPEGLCKAKRLIYITTAGGPINTDFGFSYIKTLAETFYGIKEVVCFKAEHLDVDGIDVSAVLENTKAEIKRYINYIQK